MGAAIAMHNISKTFGRNRVLTDVDLELDAGEIHGLIGQNGSGKSTLIKVMSGYVAPDEGSVLKVGGEEVSLPVPPGAALGLGVSFVHQHPALVDDLSVAENLWLGRYDTGSVWRIRGRRMRQRTIEVTRRFGLDVDPQAPVSSLSAARKSLLAIAKAVVEVEDKPGGAIILDEPTARLDRDGVALLFAAMRAATDRGAALMFVSHRLDKVLKITDRVTALRGGRVVGTTQTSETSEEDLIEMIVGTRLGNLYPEPSVPREQPLFRAEGVCGRIVRNLSLELQAGEIVGISGLPGTGFDELPYLLMDATGDATGSCQLGSVTFDLAKTTLKQRIAGGMALVPGDRARDGAALDLSASENVTLLNLSEFLRRGILMPRRERATAHELLQWLKVRPDDPELAFKLFSGGNQQKVVLAKWLRREPKLLILHEPTQGVDIEARKQIFGIVSDLAAKGMGIILASVEYEDLAHLCHRVLVLRDGEIARTLTGAHLTADAVLEECYRAQRRTEVRAA